MCYNYIMSDMIIHDMPGGVIYIENAFPKAKEFLDFIESNNENDSITKVIPPWSTWIDGYPVSTNPDDMTKWEQIFPDDEHHLRGVAKSIDWDLSHNEYNNYWPRKNVSESTQYGEAHEKSLEAIKMIEDDYVKALSIWAGKTNNSMPNHITRNYCIRKYRVGGSMGPHIDRNVLNPKNSMDWTSLIYLNDDYEGGEIAFDQLGYSIKPSAGSVVFLPCLTSHEVYEVLSGNKTYIFLFMHTGTGITSALGEPYHELEDKIKIFNSNL
jgi:hypothetical protein